MELITGSLTGLRGTSQTSEGGAAGTKGGQPQRYGFFRHTNIPSRPRRGSGRRSCSASASYFAAYLGMSCGMCLGIAGIRLSQPFPRRGWAVAPERRVPAARAMWSHLVIMCHPRIDHPLGLWRYRRMPDGLFQRVADRPMPTFQFALGLRMTYGGKNEVNVRLCACRSKQFCGIGHPMVH